MMSKLQTIPRTRSQVVGVTSKIRNLTKSAEKTTLLELTELRRQHRHLISQQPELFTGLQKLYSDGFVGKFERIVTVFGGHSSRSSISSTGFSNLIEFCLNYDLPIDDSVLKAIGFVCFQIHSNELRNGGACAHFDMACEHFRSASNASTYAKHISVKSIGGNVVITFNFKALTHVTKYAGYKELRSALLSRQDGVSAEHVGSFFNNCKINGNFDALSFCGLKMKQQCIIMLGGKALDVGIDYFKQLLAEVNVLMKLKKGASGVVLHGNNQHGFVKPVENGNLERVSQLRLILSDSNREQFISNPKSTGARDSMLYQYPSCVLHYIDPITFENRSNCVFATNMSNLLEHKLLHYGRLGAKCRDPECNVVGRTDEKLYSALPNLIGNGTTIKDRINGLESTEVEPTDELISPIASDDSKPSEVELLVPKLSDLSTTSNYYKRTNDPSTVTGKINAYLNPDGGEHSKSLGFSVDALRVNMLSAASLSQNVGSDTQAVPPKIIELEEF